MSKLLKPFTEIDEQIRILQDKDLEVSDIEDVYIKLLHHNYYTVVNGYKSPFLDRESSNERYISGTSFNEVFALYTFDCNLRSLLLEYILKAEHELKSVISHYFAKKHQEEKYPDYLDIKNFDIRKDGTLPPKKEKLYEKLRNDIETELKKQQTKHNQMLEHYNRDYKNIPPWILVSIFSFGMLRCFYSCLNNKDQNDIARVFSLAPERLDDYLGALNTYRNSCAHDERIYNKPLRSKVVRKDANEVKREYSRVYIVILILKDLLDASTFMSFYSKLDDYISELERNLKSIQVDKILYAMGMPLDKSVRKAELGPLARGSALSDQEFHDVLVHYIMPILPITAKLVPVSDKDPMLINSACKLVEYKNNTLYFAQASNSTFVYCTHLCEVILTASQVEDIEAHLTALIDYIHIFWNLSNLSAYGRDKVAIAFPTLCEQAYELTICSLMCKKDSLLAAKEYAKDYQAYKQRIGQEPKEKRAELTASIRSKENDLKKVIEREGIAEKTLYGILSQIEVWATKTYEGQKKTFGIVLCTDQFPSDGDTFDYVEFLKSDYSATINDGIYSAVELYADGSFKEHLNINTPCQDRLPSIPYPFSNFAKLCEKNKIGVLLTSSSDILIINNSKLCYTRHNGNWLRCMADKIIDQIEKEVDLESREQAEVIYQAVVDVSYSRGGACIGIVNTNDLPPDLNDMVKAGLLSNEQLTGKLLALKTMISTKNGSNLQPKSFYELDRALRRELLELDGAMVLSSNGTIHVIGTIIKLAGSGSDGGGRTAAAMQLSEYGLAIKVSQDGYVQIFKNRKAILEIMT